MPTLPTQSFLTIVSNISAGIQGRASQLLNFTTGSTLRAIAEGFAGVFLWFQSLVLQLLTAIRLSTASGADVDTFTADFMPVVPGTTSPRLGSQAASGQVTFSRATAGPSSCFVPVGATLLNDEGSVAFIVIADPTFPYYTPGPPAGYVMASAVSSIVVPVIAQTPGSVGNVAAGDISVMTSSITGVDSVTNAAGFTNGADQESDSALKARFSAYILGLSRGDKYGLTASIEGVDVTVQWTLTEDYNYDGSYRPGYFFVVVDDGSGNPSAPFLQAMTDAVNAVRPLGIQAGVFEPQIIDATVSLTIAVLPNYDSGLVSAAVSAAITNGINSLGLGNSLPYSLVAGWAYGIPGVQSVSALLVNGQSGDVASISAVTPTQDHMFEMGLFTVKCNTVIVTPVAGT